ncbi:phage holin family protein [Humidisolicoccus flavus]|uniref:phage holin family protein n=1 Tax=Humidisolicoccus flavus TaxID=3111414 RepID=UPI00324B6258
MAERRSLGELIAEVPGLLIDLVKAEIAGLKAEVTGKVKKLGVGGALLAVAGILALFLLGVLLTAAVLGLATVFEPWLAALIVAGGLLLLIAILALSGIGLIKRGVPMTPTDSLESIRRDVNVVRGIGNDAARTAKEEGEF